MRPAGLLKGSSDRRTYNIHVLIALRNTLKLRLKIRKLKEQNDTYISLINLTEYKVLIEKKEVIQLIVLEEGIRITQNSFRFHTSRM
jgi:hypothetical protein